MDIQKFKKLISLKQILFVIVSHLALSLICYLAYRFLVEDAIGLSLSFLNWVGILIITLALFPSRFNTNKNVK